MMLSETFGAVHWLYAALNLCVLYVRVGFLSKKNKSLIRMTIAIHSVFCMPPHLE